MIVFSRTLLQWGSGVFRRFLFFFLNTELHIHRIGTYRLSLKLFAAVEMIILGWFQPVFINICLTVNGKGSMFNARILIPWCKLILKNFFILRIFASLPDHFSGSEHPACPIFEVLIQYINIEQFNKMGILFVYAKISFHNLAMHCPECAAVSCQ